MQISNATPDLCQTFACNLQNTRQRRHKELYLTSLALQDSNEGAGGWLRLTVQKVAGVASISLVQIEGQGTAWQSMDNEWGASWEIAASPTPPLDLRIVQTDGSEVKKLPSLQPVLHCLHCL